MATKVGWASRCGQLVLDGALKLRGPARWLFGSLRAAILVGALLLTAVLLAQLIFVGRMYNTSSVMLLVMVALVTNVGLVYGTLNSKLDYVYGWMAFSLLRLPTAILCAMFAQYYTIAVGIPVVLFHFLLELLLLALSHGHAHEERRGGRADGGWLHSNLQQAPPPPPDSAGALPFKATQQASLAQPHSPAVLAPSACTTAAPHHPPAANQSQC